MSHLQTLLSRMRLSAPWGGGIAIIYALVIYIALYIGSSFVYFLVGLVITPFCVSALYLAIADPEARWPAQRATGHCLFLSVSILLSTILLFQEGTICVLMAAPIFLSFALFPIPLIRSLLSRNKTRHLPMLLVLLPLVSTPVERGAAYPERYESVEQHVDVASPPEHVWRTLLTIPDIRPSERMMTFSHDIVGMPGPLEARLEGTGIGAVRHSRWERNVHFKETIIGWEPARLLSWRFQFQTDSIPREIESHVRVDADYLRIETGQYALTPLPDGGTRLSLATRYRMATPFNDYCAWWGRVFLGDVHRTVLGIVKARAEQSAATVPPLAPSN